MIDGRKSIPELAKELSLTKAEVTKDYRILENKGIINGATIHINYKSFGYKAVAYMLINVEPAHAPQLAAFLQNMPEVYSFYCSGPKGSIDVVTTLKQLQQLDEIKDSIKSNFSVSEIRTAIWTDVKEMHGNLALIPDQTPKERTSANANTKYQTARSPNTIAVDAIDEKIANKLAEDGRAPMEAIAKEVSISLENTKKRYARLRKNGVLKVTIQINPLMLGYRALGIFFAVTSDVKSSTIIDEISKIPDVISIMKTSGTYDLQIYAFIRDIDELLAIQDALAEIEGITKIDREIFRLRDKWPTPRQYISTF